MPKPKKSVVQLNQDYHLTFESSHGQRVLYDLMKRGHLLHSSMVRGDVNETIFREGERNLVLQILSQLQTSPEQLRQKIEEGNDE